MPRRWDEKDGAERALLNDNEEETLSWKDRIDELKTPFLPPNKVFAVIMFAALLFSSWDIARRLAVEWGHRTVAAVMEFRDISSLSRQAGEAPEDVYAQLAERGVRGVTVQEFTGRDLAAGNMPLWYGPLASLPERLRAGLDRPFNRAAILIDSSEPMLPAIMEYFRIRMPSVEKFVRGRETIILLPAAVDELGDSGLLPDFSGMNFAEKVGAKSLYRPAPASDVDGGKAAASLAWIKNRYPSFSCVIPAGQVVAGYPQLDEIAAVLKDMKIPVAQAEFVRQIGASALYSAVKPLIIPLHSLVRDELISRAMTRAQVSERMIRAVHERSIRILLIRPYDMYSVGKLPFLLEDTRRIHDSLISRGYVFGWPSVLPMFSASFGAALGMALVFTVCLWLHARRYVAWGAGMTTKLECSALVACAVVIGLAIWKLPMASRLLGGVCAALVATEATIWALDHYEKPFAGLTAGLLIVFAGGLVIAAFYGTTNAMLRLAPFSGVKLTLLLPPVLILANDMKRRVHPESIKEIMLRPSLWGELLMVGFLLAAAFILTIRSDNSAFVPGWEVRFRDLLERVLWVRPRTKEFLVGYPCLVIYHALIKRGWIAQYREVFRVGASLSFASSVNTFCHFHTLLPLTLVRVVNGWWLGLLVGFVALVLLDYIGGPIWRKGGREIFD
jgi:hypothetical protein